MSIAFLILTQGLLQYSKLCGEKKFQLDPLLGGVVDLVTIFFTL